MKVVLEQDSLDWWRAVIVDGAGNSLAQLAWHRERADAENEAASWIKRRRDMGMDVVGGGYR